MRKGHTPKYFVDSKTRILRVLLLKVLKLNIIE